MKDLTKRLDNLSSLLEKHGQDIEGRAWHKAVTTFKKALDKFEGQAQEAAKNLAPGMRDFLKFVENPASKEAFKLPFIGKMYRELTGKRVPSDAKAADLKKAILASVKELRNPKDALTVGVRILSEITAPTTPVPKEREKLLLELQRLGGLTDDQFEYELQTRYKKAADLKALAQAAKIPVKQRKAPAIILDIIQTARRQHGHQIPL